jgi:hypothetical protein
MMFRRALFDLVWWASLPVSAVHGGLHVVNASAAAGMHLDKVVFAVAFCFVTAWTGTTAFQTGFMKFLGITRRSVISVQTSRTLQRFDEFGLWKGTAER